MPSPDELTPVTRPGPLRAPPDWPAAAVAIVRIVCANATALLLVRWGMLPPEAAMGTAGAALLPALVRLLRRRRNVRLGEPPRSDGGHLLPPGGRRGG